MKKLLFVMAVLFGCTTVSYAQTSFIATLQHEGEFSHYYGAGALKSAYNAAADGDIITLSPGTFTWSGNFVKGITLRGAGIDATEPTYISSGVDMACNEGLVMVIEGIRFNGEVRVLNQGAEQGTIKFIKNWFSSLSARASSTYSSDKSVKVRLYNNIINSMYFDYHAYPDYLFYNCYVENPRCYNSSETSTTFVNCIINWTNSYADAAYSLNFYNTIFNWTWGSYGGTDTNFLLPNTATCYNCLSINKSTLFNNLVSGGNNKTTNSAADVFSAYRKDYTAGETFSLTDNAKTTYIGTDGTQIGMQGGNYPFNVTVQYPIITKFGSDSQTSKEGILNVEVEVDGK